MNLMTFKFNMESFYFSTHLPIKSYSLNGDEVFSVGHADNPQSLLEKIDLDMLLSQLKLNKKNTPIDISPIEDVFFTVCPIYSYDYKYGFYLIGPYSTNEDSNRAIFKPMHCISYLINILYISKDTSDTADVDANIISTIKTIDNIPNDCIKTSYNLNVNKAIKYIEENYKSQITLDDICKNININKSYFCTIFKEHTGKTFSHYLSHYRVDKSKELLKSTDLPITEIAFTVGYNSVNYFNNNFKRLTNMTPAQYRNSK